MHLTTNAQRLLELARQQMMWRKGIQAEPPAEQQRIIENHAGTLAIAESDIGRAAIAIGDALTDLRDSMQAFLDRWPDGATATAAAVEAVTVAGLAHVLVGPGRRYDCDMLGHTTNELRRWLPIVEVIEERLEGCWEPDTATGPKEQKAAA